MLIVWRNGVLSFGKDVFLGPPRWRLGLYWNRQEDMPGEQPPKEGDIIFMDKVELRFSWPWK